MIDPCGQVMDMLRSCYTTDMQFDDEGTLIAPVRWYFAADDAAYYPSPHLFGSTNWRDQGQPILGPGERWDSPKVWSNGARPPGASGTAGVQCGDPDWFVNGVPPGTPPLTVTSSGLGACCAGGPGVLVGGTSSYQFAGPYPSGGIRPGATHPPAGCVPWSLELTPAIATVPNPTITPATVGTTDYYVWALGGSPAVAIYEYAGESFCGDYSANDGQLVIAIEGVTEEWFALPFDYYPRDGYALYQVPADCPWNPGSLIALFPGVIQATGIGGIEVGATSSYQPLPYSGVGGSLTGATSSSQILEGGVGGSEVGAIASSMLVPPETGGGIEAGATSSANIQPSPASNEGIGGPLPGATSVVQVLAGGVGGSDVGATAQGEWLAAPTSGGDQVGAIATGDIEVSTEAGVKPGGTSSGLLQHTESGGVEVGATSANQQGVLTTCCPGQLLPTSLSLTISGSPDTATLTWNGSSKYWVNTATSGAFQGITLACVAGVWTLGSAKVGCAYTGSVTSGGCGPPLSLTFAVNAPDTTCPTHGHFTITLTG